MCHRVASRIQRQFFKYERAKHLHRRPGTCARMMAGHRPVGESVRRDKAMNRSQIYRIMKYMKEGKTEMNLNRKEV
jgi:hypothetical protein